MQLLAMAKFPALARAAGERRQHAQLVKPIRGRDAPFGNTARGDGNLEGRHARTIAGLAVLFTGASLALSILAARCLTRRQS